MSENQDVDVLVCATLREAEMIARGSVVTVCSRCSVAVVLAPSGAKLVKESGFVVVCFDCAESIITSPNAELMITPESMAEIKTAIPNHLRERN